MHRKKIEAPKNLGKAKTVSPSEKSEKKSRREKIRIAELELKILRRDRHKTRSLIISALQIVNNLLKHDEDPIMIGKALIQLGHKDSTVQDFFLELANYSPPLLKPFYEYKYGKIGTFTSNFYAVLQHDVKFWNELKELHSANESEIADIEKLGKLLEEFEGLSKRVVRV